MANVTQLNPGTWQISLPFQGQYNIIGSYLIAGNNELALIDPGPGSTIEALLTSIREAGFDPKEVTHLLATHIHLDHAGSVGSLLRYMPKAKVYAHSKGVPHLVDTTKVVASATRIYGERMQELWGEIEPTPSERIQALEGGTVLSVAGRRLEVHYTPGHAVHHVIFFDVHSGELFAGDVAGVRLQKIDYVRPPTPPPDIDLEAWNESLDTLKKLRPDVLYIAHFGPTRNAAYHIEQLRKRLTKWGEIVLDAMRRGYDEEDLIPLFINNTQYELERATTEPDAVQRYEIAANYAMSVQGYMRYWRKRHPERL